MIPAEDPPPPGAPDSALCALYALLSLSRGLSGGRGGASFALRGFYARYPLQRRGQQPSRLGVGLALGVELFSKCGDKLAGTVVGSFWFGCGVVFQQDVQPPAFACTAQRTALHSHPYSAYADTQCYSSITYAHTLLARSGSVCASLSHARRLT